MPKLSIRREADRKVLLAELLAVRDIPGWSTYCRHDGPREFTFYARHASGWGVQIWVNGATRHPDIFVLSWFTESNDAPKANDGFGGVNPYHRRKATWTHANADTLAIFLRGGMTMISDGSAFEREPAPCAS